MILTILIQKCPIDPKDEIITLILTSSTIDKKLENFEFIFEIFVYFEFNFEIFANFEFNFKFFVNFEFFVNDR